MGGLGNGRRGGRSPPLMIGALIACILVLGFNYWVSSSRNLELQEKLYDLEGQVRRGAAERGVAELKKNEFQEEIQRQKEQIGRIENLYKRQLDEAQSTCGKDKGTMQLNISSSAKTIQQLKGQLNQLNGDFGKLQKQLQSCQGNLNTLNKKLTYDMTQCNTQILSQKELCEERVSAAKLEIQKKLDKLQQAPGSSQVIEAAVDTAEAEKAGQRVEDETKVSSVVNVTDDQPNEPSPLLTNEIIEDKGLEPPVDLPLDKVPPKTVSESVPQGAAVKHDTLPSLTGAGTPQEGGAAPVKLQKNNLTENKAVEVMDVHNEEGKNEVETDPGVEDMLIGQDKADDNPIGPKVDEPEDYDGEEQMAGGVDLEKSQNQQKENIDKDLEEEVADYNGDDDNEGEFEADKQAELAQD